ncbi:MAG: sporulation protein YtxC [Bacillota bacterium]
MSITISTLDCSEEIKDILVKENYLLKNKGIQLFFDEDKKDDITLFKIYLDDKNKILYANKHLANIIAGVVLNNLEEKLVKKIVNNKFNKFTENEREKIISLAVKQLKDSMYEKNKDKKLIVQRILKYLDNNNNFNLEGFVRFRLKEYMYNIHLAIKQAVDNMIIEKEYEEFIELLEYFVSLQDIKIPLVHLYKKEDGSYKLVDKNGKIIKNNLVKSYIKELLEEEISYEDILISSLINLSPGKIIIHFDNKELSKTLNKIFKDKIEVDFS